MESFARPTYVAHFLNRNSTLCIFCQTEPKTIDHLFSPCPFFLSLWQCLHLRGFTPHPIFSYSSLSQVLIYASSFFGSTLFTIMAPLEGYRNLYLFQYHPLFPTTILTKGVRCLHQWFLLLLLKVNRLYP